MRDQLGGRAISVPLAHRSGYARGFVIRVIVLPSSFHRCRFPLLREHHQIAVGICDPGNPLAPRHVGRICYALDTVRACPRKDLVDVVNIDTEFDPVPRCGPLCATVQRFGRDPAQADLRRLPKRQGNEGGFALIGKPIRLDATQ